MDSRLSAASTPTYACSPKTISPKAGAGHALASSYARSGGACIIPDMDTLVYVGTFSVRRSEGVYIYRMDPESGELVQIGAARLGRTPRFSPLTTSSMSSARSTRSRTSTAIPAALFGHFRSIARRGRYVF
jgi:hypothetical protein